MPDLNAFKLLDLINGSWRSQVLHVAAELRLADHLAGGGRSGAELAEATGAHAPSLQRLLRALSALDVVRELPDGRFELTAMGALLPGLGAWARWCGTFAWAEWGELLYCVKTGASGREHLSGKPGFSHLEDDPVVAEVFNRAMAELTGLVAEGVVESYDFSPFRQVVDIGGGYGELLAAILQRHPGVEGILFDRPHAIEGARRHLGEVGVLDRCQLVTGDFLIEVPTGADAYVLKSIVHDWADDIANRLLAACRAAMPAGARLLLVERVMPAQLTTSAANQDVVRADLHMLVALGAKERNEAEFDALLAGAGLVLTDILPAGLGFSVLEARARQG